MDAVEKLRDLVAGNMLPTSPLGQAVLMIADEFEAHVRGFDALTERIAVLEGLAMQDDRNENAIERRDDLIVHAVRAAKAAERDTVMLRLAEGYRQGGDAA